MEKLTKENAYGLLKELLRMEEAGDTLNLTRAERAQFHEIMEDVFADKPVSMVSVDTHEGELRAYVDNDLEYPAINVLLAVRGTTDEIAIASTEYSMEHGLRSIIFGDALREDYTHMETLKNLDEYRKQMGEESEKDKGKDKGCQ